MFNFLRKFKKETPVEKTEPIKIVKEKPKKDKEVQALKEIIQEGNTKSLTLFNKVSGAFGFIKNSLEFLGSNQQTHTEELQKGFKKTLSGFDQMKGQVAEAVRSLPKEVGDEVMKSVEKSLKQMEKAGVIQIVDQNFLSCEDCIIKNRTVRPRTLFKNNLCHDCFVQAKRKYYSPS